MKNTIAAHSTIIGTIIEFTNLIFSMPSATIIAPSIAIASPSIGTPVIERITNSPPAHIEQSDMLAEKNMHSPISLFLGIRFSLPTIRKSPHSVAINTEDIATFSGDESPKNRAISLPEENPAPIAVPIYKKVIFNDFFIFKKICRSVDCYEKNAIIKFTYKCIIFI